MKKMFLLAICCWASNMAMQKSGVSTGDRQFNAFKQEKERSIQHWRDAELAFWMVIAGVGSGVGASIIYKRDIDQPVCPRVGKSMAVAFLGALGGALAFLSARDVSAAEELRLKRKYAFNKLLDHCSQCAQEVSPIMTSQEQQIFKARKADKAYANVLCPEHKKRADAAALAAKSAAEARKAEFTGDTIIVPDYAEVVGSGYNN